MQIGGIQKVTLIDYPGKVAAVLFARGCNFRCPWCHNPELVDPARFGHLLPEDDIFQFLKSRQGKLDAVVISGGEPTLAFDLPDVMSRIRKMGFFVKLDTNGSHPDMLDAIFKKKLADFVAMDVKAPAGKYAALAGVAVDHAAITRSIEAILKSGLGHEFRTTVIPSRLSQDDIAEISETLRGAERYVLQTFRKGVTLSNLFPEEAPLPADELIAMQNRALKTVRQVLIR